MQEEITSLDVYLKDWEHKAIGGYLTENFYSYRYFLQDALEMLPSNPRIVEFGTGRSTKHVIDFFGNKPFYLLTMENGEPYFTWWKELYGNNPNVRMLNPKSLKEILNIFLTDADFGKPFDFCFIDMDLEGIAFTRTNILENMPKFMTDKGLILVHDAEYYSDDVLKTFPIIKEMQVDGPPTTRTKLLGVTTNGKTSKT